MVPRPAIQGIRSFVVQQGVLDLFLWAMLGIFAVQALMKASAWGVGWVVLGAAVLVLKKNLLANLSMIVEVPIFLYIFSYSATTLYLADKMGSYDLVNDPKVNEAEWIALAGTACFAAGLFWNLSKARAVGVLRRLPVTVTKKQAIIIYVVGVISNDVLLRIAPTSVWVVVFVFGLCAPIGLFILMQLNMDAPVKWVGTWPFFLWLGALLEWSIRSVLGGIFGSTLLILFMFMAHYTRKSSSMLLIIVATGVILAPLLQDTKSDYRQKLAGGTQATQNALENVVSENFKKVFLNGEMNAYSDGATKLAERLCSFDIWLAVKRHMDVNHDYAGGQTIIDALVTAFIPRIFWPDKPITGGSNELAEKYGDMVIAEGTSVGVGAIGELYINGGTWAVLFGMLSLGCLAGFLLKMGYLDHVQPVSSLIALAIFASFVRPEVNLSDLLGGVIRMIFLWLVLRGWVIHQNRRGPTRAASM